MSELTKSLKKKKNHANVDIVIIVLLCNLFKKKYVSITYNDEINSLEDFF